MSVTDERVPVNMGQLAVATGNAAELCALGLGSCIGLALCDVTRGVFGLAHVVLPESTGHRATDNRFADFAVPALVDALEAAGARRASLGAWLVGGASMFAAASSALDIGARNEEAVRDLLKARRIPVRGAQTGGRQGRTIRVLGAGRTVLVREAGGADRPVAAGR